MPAAWSAWIRATSSAMRARTCWRRSAIPKSTAMTRSLSFAASERRPPASLAQPSRTVIGDS
ncbi:hypothetical protein CG724_11895 [Streptomyces sp. CB02120-2]|nr:hypothetical protein CG724_11895 [Streptomyces sp. CB02120-2]